MMIFTPSGVKLGISEVALCKATSFFMVSQARLQNCSLLPLLHQHDALRNETMGMRVCLDHRIFIW
jgi:hypothetical protein